MMAAIAGLASNTSAAAVNLTQFRWRNDDGGEATATWRADPDYPAMFPTNGNIRLRYCVEANSGSAELLLQYTDNPHTPINTFGGTNDFWITIPATVSTQAFEMAYSPWFGDKAATTDQLGEGGTFQSGSMVEAPSWASATVNLPAGHRTNVEFCFKPTLHAITNRVYRFRVNTTSGAAVYNNELCPVLKLRPDCPGDVNGDGVVNEEDLSLVISNFGKTNR
jgi:hypothetical protein